MPCRAPRLATRATITRLHVGQWGTVPSAEVGASGGGPAAWRADPQRFGPGLRTRTIFRAREFPKRSMRILSTMPTKAAPNMAGITSVQTVSSRDDARMVMVPEMANRGTSPGVAPKSDARQPPSITPAVFNKTLLRVSRRARRSRPTFFNKKNLLFLRVSAPLRFKYLLFHQNPSHPCPSASSVVQKSSLPLPNRRARRSRPTFFLPKNIFLRVPWRSWRLGGKLFSSLAFCGGGLPDGGSHCHL